MKKNILYPAIAIIGLSMFTACKKSSSSTTSTTTTSGKSMTATVNGKSENTSTVTAVKSTVSGVTELAITGIFSDGHQLLITVFGFNTTGTYNFNVPTTSGSSTAFWFATGAATTLSNTANTGQMDVTSSNSTGLSGTFSFVTNDSTVVSNGSFSALY
ncbi:MAG: hypothetical protein ACTHJ0_09645 [Flavipsychrobacter sp.]